MTIIRTLMIFLFCRYEDFTVLGKNGAVKQILERGRP
jgi:hypothetical protein